MKLGKFLQMIDAYTDINMIVSIRRDICVTPMIETRLFTASYEAMPYENLKVTEFGIHNGKLEIVVK